MFTYLIFGFNEHYPNGGMQDCVFKTKNIELVITHVIDWSNQSLENLAGESIQVYQTEDDRIIFHAEVTMTTPKELIVHRDHLSHTPILNVEKFNDYLKTQ